MASEALYTEITDSKTVNGLEIIHENFRNFPDSVSNIYAKNQKGEIVWYAEVPSPGDLYTETILWNKSIQKNAKNWEELFVDNPRAFSVASWNGFTGTIDYETGKIISSEFTK